MLVRTSFLLILSLAFIPVLNACDACGTHASQPAQGGASGFTASTDNDGYKWSFDTSFEYRNFAKVDIERAHAIHESDRDTHGFLYDWHVTSRFGYSVTKDLNVGISQSYRLLKMRNIHGGPDHHDEEAEAPEDGEEAAPPEPDVPDPILGRRETSKGLTDLTLDVKWRFKKQEDGGFPVDLALFGSLKPPSGDSNNRNPDGKRFEEEEQPGTGSWNGTIGIAASKTWGPWGASGAVSHTFKGEGTQHFKEGDATVFSLSGSRLMTPKKMGLKIYTSLGVQTILEDKAVEYSKKSPDHGGQNIFLLPAVTIQPIKRLTISIGGSVPVYQEENGFHQKQDFGAQIHVGVRF